MRVNVETSGRPPVLGILLFLVRAKLLKKHMAKLKENLSCQASSYAICKNLDMNKQKEFA